MGGIADSFKSKRNLISLAILLILVVSLPLIFKLAQETQIFKPKASSQSVEIIPSSGVTTKQENGRTIIETTSPDIQLQITSPLDNQQSSDAGFSFVKPAYAAGSGKNYYCGQDRTKIFTTGWFGMESSESCPSGTTCQAIPATRDQYGNLTVNGVECRAEGAAPSTPSQNQSNSSSEPGFGPDYYCDSTDGFTKIHHENLGFWKVSDSCPTGTKCQALPVTRDQYGNSQLGGARCLPDTQSKTNSSASNDIDSRTVRWFCGDDQKIYREYRDIGANGQLTQETRNITYDDYEYDCNKNTPSGKQRTCKNIPQEESAGGKPDAVCVEKDSQAPDGGGEGAGDSSGTDPSSKPGYCAGYSQQCEMSDDNQGNPTGVQYCTGGKYNSNNTCGYEAGYTIVPCSPCQRPGAGGGATGSSSSSPNTGGSNSGSGGSVGSGANHPASFGGSKTVNTCVGSKTLDQLKIELQAAGYNGSWNEGAAVAAYNNAACPTRPADCRNNPPVGGGIGDKPDGYNWIASCEKACLRNSDCPVSTDPSIAGDPGMYEKTAANPDGAINKTNWCYGFQGGNRCLMLMRDGTTPQTPASPVPAASTNPQGATNWIAPTCTGGKQVGCRQSNQAACTDYGTTAQTFAACKEACEPQAQRDTKCANPAPAGSSYEQISGAITDTCNKPVANVKVRLIDPVKGSQELTTGSDGKFSNNSYIAKGSSYKVQLVTSSIDYAKYSGLDTGYSIDTSNCGTSCNYKLIGKNCGGTRTIQSVVRQDAEDSDTQRITTQYRVTDNLANFASDANALWQSYTPGGMTIDFAISDKTPGVKSIFVQFKDDQGTVFNANPYPIQIIYNPNSGTQQSTQNTPSQRQVSQNCPVNDSCCSQGLQTCTGNGKDTSCPSGFQWCFSGYCVNDNYNPSTNSCAAKTPAAPAVSEDPCLNSCGACPTQTDKCGNTTYMVCDYSPCTAAGATATTTYTCRAATNSNCQGSYLCGSVCAAASGNSTTPAAQPSNSCTIGQTCTCSGASAGSCDQCNGGWCNGGVCASCQPG